MFLASLVAQTAKNFSEGQKLKFYPWIGKIPGEGKGNPLQYSRLENPHGESSLVGYGPWGCRESDTTARLTLTLLLLQGMFLGRRILLLRAQFLVAGCSTWRIPFLSQRG